MAYLPEPKITAWSYSRWRDYSKCPFYAKCKYVDKLKEPDSPAMARGTLVHKLAENFIKAEHQPLFSSELSLFRDEFRYLRRLHAKAEEQWAFNANWEPVDWFAPNAWCRVKVDAFARKHKRMGLVVDFKTGKINPDHQDQLSLYAIGAFIMDPEIVVADTQNWYLDLGKKTENVIFTVGMLEDLKKTWHGRVRALLADRDFVPRPNESCKWCAFSCGKGGPCVY